MSLGRWINRLFDAPAWPLVIGVWLILLIAMAFVLIGCASTTSPPGSVKLPENPPADGLKPPPAPKVTPGATPEARALAEARAERDRLREAVAAADARVKNAEEIQAQAVRAERDAQIHRWINWLSLVSGLGMLAGIAIGVLAMVWGLGFGAKIPFGLAAMFGAMLVVLRATSLAYAHLDAIGYSLLGLLVLSVLWALWHFRKTIQVALAGIRVGSESLHALSVVANGEADPVVAASELKVAALGRQYKAGIQTTMDRLAARFNPAKNPKAESPITITPAGSA